MMTEKQRTFGAAVGLDKVVPTARHDSDLVECSDGTFMCHADVHYDCKENPHSNDEDRHDADVEIVVDLLNGVDEWVTEYCTKNTDYTSMYDHIVDEDTHYWPHRVGEWIDNTYGDWRGHSKYDDFKDVLVNSICEGLQGSLDCEPEYHANEWAAYSGNGCCLWSVDIGEHEEQIDISCFPELQELHDRGDLDDVLDDVNCNVYISRSKRRVKNEETGRYEYVGRDTYMPYGRKDNHPTFEVYTNPSGQWQFVVSKERMEELLTAAIVELAGYTDRK
jgi:hypothetical protein